MKFINQIKLFILFLVFIFPVDLSFSQNSELNIYGKVIDAQTKEPLQFANVTVLGTNNGSSTNEDGNYEIKKLSYNTYQLKASVIGYNPIIKTDIIVQPGKPTEVNFELMEEAVELNKVTVVSDYFSQNPIEVNSVKNFSYEEIRRSPGGFEDVIRALSILPGVAQADAGRNDLIVRGGAPSENLYLIDGIEVSNINHFGGQGVSGGPLSYINLDFVRETAFSTGGFSALYGDKLSSVLDIKLRDGRQDRIGGKATISASQFGLDVEGPISEKSNFIISARRSYLDFIFKAAGFAFVPEYYDLLAKTNFNLDSKNKISLLFVGALDNVKFFNDTEEQRYDNSTILGSDQTQYVAGINYRHLIDRGFFNIILSRNYVDYNSIQSDIQLNPIFQNKSLEIENALRAELVFKLSDKSEINLGGTAKFIEANYNIFFPTFVTTFGDSLPISNLKTKNLYKKFGTYFNYNRLLFNKLNFNLGIRGDYFSAINNELSVSPRFSLSYKLNELTDINFSTGIYRQSPSYIWLEAFKSNKKLNMLQAVQYVLGFDYKISEDAIFNLEGFYKNYSNYPTSTARPYLVLANTGAGFEGGESNFSSFGLEPLVNDGFGKARGIEVSIQKAIKYPLLWNFQLNF